MCFSTNVEQPTPPAQPSTADAIKEWVSSMPEVFRMQQEFAPQEAAQQVQLAQQYAQPMGEAMLSAQKAMYPEEYALRDTLSQQAQAGMQSGVPDWMQQKYIDQMRAQLGEQAGAGIGADYMSRGLLQQQQDWQNYYQNMALSLTGSQPVFGASQPQTSNYMSGFTPQSAMTNSQQGYGSYAGLYGNMYGANAQLGASQNSMWGDIIGGAFGGAGMAMSSIILKENINEIDSPLETVKELHGVLFDWKENKQRDGGVIAEELEKIIPSCVVEVNGIKHIKPMMIIAYLIEAVKELSSKRGN